MDYQIALAPELGISAAQLAAQWNDNDETRALGAASVAPNAGQQFDLAAVVELVIIPLAVSISANAFYDLLKARIVAAGTRKRTELVAIEQPDGSCVVVVTSEEE